MLLKKIFALLLLTLYHYPAIAECNLIKTFAYKQNKTITPASIEHLQRVVLQAKREHTKIAIVGENKSMGGQTVTHAQKGCRVSLKKLNKLINLNIAEQTVTVQAGMTWRELQCIIAPCGFAIRAMQSYNDFSIGGSLGVNVHGQDIQDAPIIKTVKSFKLLQANGKVISVSRNENSELFELVIGGYGLFGIITEVTLYLAQDAILERRTKTVKSHQLAKHVTSNITNNKNIDFYSARFSLGMRNLFEDALVITYHRIKNITDTSFQSSSRNKYFWNRPLLAATKISKFVKSWRFFFEKLYLKKNAKITRNNLQNISICTLPQWSFYILQEYFIPYKELNLFMNKMKRTIKKHNINIINVSARHVPKDNESLLSFAPQDCCALVLYINIDKNCTGYHACTQWTHKLINHALTCQGSFYLPYHILADDTQILKAYPNLPIFIKKKKEYDPLELFSNALYEKYAHLGNQH